eukprot:CAMPEP_0172301926 /NCGR_PEP_ID=MMETSP1058-20130122/3732_1 /TAXON_ID=83371 /ORGANISM="Detonula confervacea, Strain CCMP 353" /LENGTH=335 /DNA_ID=CAMNT_0013012245 /DNA_START=427 /DNA_END=1434 /DNA_ORIENTATION=+
METDGNGEQERGTEEAFASLESLSPEDWNGKSNNMDENSEVNDNLKHSRTDDTHASDTGKSTKEEVGYYLEMQEELEGTEMTQQDAEAEEIQQLDELFEIEEMMETGEDHYDNEASDELEEEYPWTSINPILRIRGPVASGYGRGGKKLGVPTANLPASLFQSALEDVTNGVYFGWAVIEDDKSSIKKGRNKPIKAVVNVGYSPTFEGKENKEKIVEAHLITGSSPMEKPESSSADNDGDDEQLSDNDTTTDEIEGDFYNETMRLQLIGYLRPEQKFDSFPELIAQIHRDIGNANWALDTMPFVFSKEDEFVKDGVDWVGSGGGDRAASWEFESW